jgi:hypothetical protein
VFESIGVVLVKPVGDEFVDGGGLNDSSREDVGTKISSFFQDKHTEVLVPSFVGELLEANGSAKSSWATSYDTDIDFIGLAFDTRGVKISVIVSKSRSSAEGAGGNWQSCGRPCSCSCPGGNGRSSGDCGGTEAGSGGTQLRAREHSRTALDASRNWSWSGHNESRVEAENYSATERERR